MVIAPKAAADFSINFLLLVITYKLSC
jgi:hypothetical protein